MIDWDTIRHTKEEYRAIARIASRAQHFGIERDRLSLIMDLELAHSVCPMDLDRLHNAKEGDFLHDVCGIIQHLDRDNGELLHCFCPRFAEVA